MMQPEHHSAVCNKVKPAAWALLPAAAGFWFGVMGRFAMQSEHHSAVCNKVKPAASGIAAGGGRILVWRNEELYDAA